MLISWVSDEIASCFDPCIDKLIDGLKQQIKLGTPPDVGATEQPY